MIELIGNTEILNKPVRHHSAALTPMRDVLVREIMLAFAQGPELHKLIQHGTGIGSWELKLSNGRQFHFRAAGERVVIKDAWFYGSPIRVLHNPEQCKAWVWETKLDMKEAVA